MITTKIDSKILTAQDEAFRAALDANGWMSETERDLALMERSNQDFFEWRTVKSNAQEGYVKRAKRRIKIQLCISERAEYKYSIY